MEKKLEPVPYHNEHGQGGYQTHSCKGHSNYLTACTYETQEERDDLLKILNNYWPDEADN